MYLSQLYNGLPIFVIQNNQFLNPSQNVNIYALLQQQFRTILASLPSQTFTIAQPNKYYRVSMAFKFYFNIKLPQNSINLITQYIRSSFQSLNNSKNLKIKIFKVNFNLKFEILF